MSFLNKIKENKWLLLILVIGSILRLYHLDFQSIWLDEIHTMIEGDPKLKYSEFYDIMVLREQMPHLYYHIVKMVSLLFGHTTFMVRLVSAIIGIFSIYLIYLLGKLIYNKNVGLTAAGLLSINYFHICYSQEARPYVLLCFFTILSFYRLIFLIRKFDLKSAILYGICAGLMINTHFFGLFVLVSQFIITVYYCFVDEKTKWLQNIKYSLISFISVLIIWIPSIPIFLIVAKIKNFWIQPPTPEVYYGLFKEFFGYSEGLILASTLLTYYYFFKIFNLTNEDNNNNKKLKFSFIIITIWILITLLIPFVRTYLDVPMIISRYFISVLPAAILVLAISFNEIKQRIVKVILLVLILSSSFTDIFLVKDYYNKVSKTQYRELAEVLIEKNKISKAKIYSVWGWHLRYFFTNNKINMLTQEQTLPEVLEFMKKDPKKKKDFWFVGAHFQKFELPPDLEAYLNSNFNLIEKIEYYDIWARYYVPKEGIESTYILDINKFEPFKSDNNLNILLFSNSTTKSEKITLNKGTYRLSVKARSLPEVPINNENAHLAIDVNNKKIGAFFVSEKIDEIKYFQFHIDKKQDVSIGLTFGNDLVLNDKDRNVLVFSVIVEKLNK